MDVHAQPVTQPMVKKTAETCFLDDGAGFGIDVVGLDARPDRGDSALLGRQDGSIDRLERGSDLTCDENSRQVTFIRMSGRSPVDQDKIVLADPGCRRRARVRQGRADADGDDRRKTRPGRPAAPQIAFERIGDVFFAFAEPQPARSIANARSA